MVVEIVVEPELARTYGAQIEATAPGQVKLLVVDGAAAEPDVGQAEIALSGWYDRPSFFARLIASMPRLCWIHSMGAGVDNFISPDFQRRGLFITNVAGANAPAMVEYCLAALITLARDFPGLLAAQRERRWIERVGPRGTILFGKRLGIVGYGSVGRHLAIAAKALGLEVWASRRRPLVASAEPLDRLLSADELPELLAACDFVVLAASLNSSTRGLIGKEELEQMKHGAILVNVARGDLIDEPALVEALRAGRLHGAVLDVTSTEPLPAESSLWGLPNVLVTPHVSGDTAEGLGRGVDLFCANLRLYLAGHPERMGNLIDPIAHL